MISILSLQSLKKFGDLLFFYGFFSLASALSTAFLRDDWTELYKFLVYDRPAFLFVQFVLIVFFNLELVNHFLNIKLGGSNIESHGKNYTLYCKYI